MYSGKSTELLRRCNRYASIGKNVLLINHELDTRTSDKIKTHQSNLETMLIFYPLKQKARKNHAKYQIKTHKAHC